LTESLLALEMVREEVGAGQVVLQQELAVKELIEPEAQAGVRAEKVLVGALIFEQQARDLEAAAAAEQEH